MSTSLSQASKRALYSYLKLGEHPDDELMEIFNLTKHQLHAYKAWSTRYDSVSNNVSDHVAYDDASGSLSISSLDLKSSISSELFSSLNNLPSKSKMVFHVNGQPISITAPEGFVFELNIDNNSLAVEVSSS